MVHTCFISMLTKATDATVVPDACCIISVHACTCMDIWHVDKPAVAESRYICVFCIPPLPFKEHGLYSTAMAVVPTAKPVPKAATADHALEATNHRGGNRERQLVGGRDSTSMGSSIRGSPSFKPPVYRPQADPTADQLPQRPMAPQTCGG